MAEHTSMLVTVATQDANTFKGKIILLSKNINKNNQDIMREFMLLTLSLQQCYVYFTIISEMTLHFIPCIIPIF